MRDNDIIFYGEDLNDNPLGQQTRCSLCPYLPDKTCTITVHNQTYRIRGTHNCNTPAAIYLIQCTKHPENEEENYYVGRTNSVRARFLNHISDIRNRKSTPIADHFNQPGHTLSDLQITIIESVRGKPNDNILNALEQKWIKRLKAQILGINRRKALTLERKISFPITYGPHINPLNNTIRNFVKDHNTPLTNSSGQPTWFRAYKNSPTTGDRLVSTALTKQDKNLVKNWRPPQTQNK